MLAAEFLSPADSQQGCYLDKDKVENKYALPFYTYKEYKFKTDILYMCVEQFIQGTAEGIQSS